MPVIKAFFIRSCPCREALDCPSSLRRRSATGKKHISFLEKGEICTPGEFRLLLTFCGAAVLGGGGGCYSKVSRAGWWWKRAAQPHLIPAILFCVGEGT
jgi:hypothetical protein